MGLVGRYIDTLPSEARDRLIVAQAWCVAGVLGEGESRCLVGHAEDWRPHAAGPEAWRSWLEAGGGAGRDELERACRPELFAFRRARPGDLPAYRARVARWGIASEGRIGARFDRLCARRGVTAAVRLVKERAGRDHAPPLHPAQALSPRSVSAMRRRIRSSRRSSETP